MIPSPMSLDSHFFTHIELKASGVEPDKAGEGVLVHRLHCMRHKEHPRKFMVSLGLKQTDDKEKGSPLYTFQFDVIGMVTVRDDYPEDKVETLARVNGAALLYAAIREMAANLSGRGPFPIVNLPTVSFIDEKAENPDPAPKKGRGKK